MLKRRKKNGSELNLCLAAQFSASVLVYDLEHLSECEKFKQIVVWEELDGKGSWKSFSFVIYWASDEW